LSKIVRQVIGGGSSTLRYAQTLLGEMNFSRAGAKSKFDAPNYTYNQLLAYARFRLGLGNYQAKDVAGRAGIFLYTIKGVTLEKAMEEALKRSNAALSEKQKQHDYVVGMSRAERKANMAKWETNLTKKNGQSIEEHTAKIGSNQWMIEVSEYDSGVNAKLYLWDALRGMRYIKSGNLQQLRNLAESSSRSDAKGMANLERLANYSRAGGKAAFGGDTYYTVAAHIGSDPAGERTFKDAAEAKAYAKIMRDSAKARANGKPVVVDVYPVVNYSPQAAILTLKASRHGGKSDFAAWKKTHSEGWGDLSEGWEATINNNHWSIVVNEQHPNQSTLYVRAYNGSPKHVKQGSVDSLKRYAETAKMSRAGGKSKFAANFEQSLKSLVQRFGFKPDRVWVDTRFGVGEIVFINKRGEATRLVSKLAPAMAQMGIPASAIKAREYDYPADDETGEDARHQGHVTIDYNMLDKHNPKGFSRPGEAEAFSIGSDSTESDPTRDERLMELATKVGKEHTVNLFARWAEGKATNSREGKMQMSRTKEELQEDISHSTLLAEQWIDALQKAMTKNDITRAKFVMANLRKAVETLATDIDAAGRAGFSRTGGFMSREGGKSQFAWNAETSRWNDALNSALSDLRNGNTEKAVEVIRSLQHWLFYVGDKVIR
jgi:hypothetical protein